MKFKNKIDFSEQVGFTLVELLVGMVVSGFVMAGAYSLWSTQHHEGFRLEKKIDLRNVIALSSKKLQRSITLAGIGLNGAAFMVKADAVGTDSLIIYTNVSENKSDLTYDISPDAHEIHVTSPSVFSGASYIAVSTIGRGEVRRINKIEGSTITIDKGFSQTFTAATSKAYPALRERYFTDQDNSNLLLDRNGTISILAENIRNFQVSFWNSHGESTEIQKDIRTVQFSFTGIFPAKEGALTSIVFSSTAIPRNTL
jgi:prepilin-type N-terminal cleavage/methylation domain-containing protein